MMETRGLPTSSYICDKLFVVAANSPFEEGSSETCDSISLISYAGCLGLSPVISAKIHVCVAAWNSENFTKNRYFWSLKSFKIIDVGTPGKHVSSACYDMQQVCVYVQTLSC